MRRWPPIAAVLVVLVAGCGGDDDEQSEAKPAPKPAASAEQFVERFERLTDIRLDPVPDTFGTRMDEPDDTGLEYRISGYQFYWTANVTDRDILLDGQPDPDGVLWERVGDGWSAAKAYGPALIVDWVGGDTKGSSPEWERLDRLTEAAYTGRNDVLEPEERPCESVGIDPMRGGTATCSVAGIPVTAVDGREALRTPAVEARVLGVSSGEGIEGHGLVPAPKPEGRYVVVAYRLRNAGEKPIRYLSTELRIGEERFDEDAEAGVFLPRVGTFPIAPGQEIEQRVAFDVPTALAERARRDGALVLPAAADELGDSNIQFAQGWVRLANAPASLPEPPQPEQPQLPPQPEGPPDIEVVRGNGPPIGGSARRLYMANSFFPMPEDFVAGGVNVGTRAGECTIPPIDRRLRASLLAAIRRDTARKEGRVGGLVDRQILVADCGAAGLWAILTWNARGGSKGTMLFVDEYERRGGRWRGSPEDRWPGCGIPEAAAAAWQIDISHCQQPRPGPPGDIS